MVKGSSELPPDVVSNPPLRSGGNGGPVYQAVAISLDPPAEGEGEEQQGIDISPAPAEEQQRRGEDPPAEGADEEQGAHTDSPIGESNTDPPVTFASNVPEDLPAADEQNPSVAQNSQMHNQKQSWWHTPENRCSLLRTTFGGLFIGGMIALGEPYNYGYPSLGLFIAAVVALVASQVEEFRHSTSGVKMAVFILTLIGSIFVLMAGAFAPNFYYNTSGFRIMITLGGVFMTIGHGLDSIVCFCSSIERNGKASDGVSKLIAALGGILFIIGGPILEDHWYYERYEAGAGLLITGGAFHMIHGIGISFKWGFVRSV